MIFDKLALYAENLAHDGTVTEVDLGAAEAGRGETIEIFFQGHSLTTGTTITIDFQTSATSGSGYATESSLSGLTAAEANAGIVLHVPANAGIKRYSLLALTGTTGGTFTAGIIPRGGAQINP